MNFFFDSGLPRSGSTLLSAILNQNRVIYAPPLSPVMTAMMTTRDWFECSENVKAFDQPEAQHNAVSGIIKSFYKSKTGFHIIDKSRLWVGHIDFIKKYINPFPKIICTVRDPLEILASFIRLIHRSGSNNSFVDRLLIEKKMSITDDNRCTMLMLGVVGESLKALQTAYIRNQMRHVHLIDYNDLVVDKPNQTMVDLYNFLGIEYFEHDFDNISHDLRENDNIYGLPEMHSVRSTLSYEPSHYADVLSVNIINKYQDLNFWKGDSDVLSSPSIQSVG